ncbi:Uncharacterised protein [Mycobacteroides abscessus subsp. massiliense]|nr:Uncharacterised protein [Mycobacteroides abscessus subsp. massiliense]
MHAGDVEAVPSVTAGAVAEHAAILLSSIIDRVMFSRNGEHVWSAQSGHHLLGLIELRVGSQVSEIAGMDHEIGRVPQIVDLIDRMTERIDHIRVGRAVESEMAVTDLGEAQRGARRRSRRGGARHMRDHLSASHRQCNGCTEPGGVPDQLTP